MKVYNGKLLIEVGEEFKYRNRTYRCIESSGSGCDCEDCIFALDNCDYIDEYDVFSPNVLNVACQQYEHPDNNFVTFVEQ